jgi:hypothetical protein
VVRFRLEEPEGHIRRGVVRQVPGDVKTRYSRKPLPLDRQLADIMLVWVPLRPCSSKSRRFDNQLVQSGLAVRTFAGSSR